MDTESIKSGSTRVTNKHLPFLQVTTAVRTQSRPDPRAEEEKKHFALPSGQSAANEEALRTHKKLTDIYERQKRAKAINLPTSDQEIKMALRQMRQPICLFGEDAIARRERLRTIVQKAYIEEGRVPLLGKPKEKKEVKEETEEKELFYTHGPEELKAARLEIALYSVPKATLRYVVMCKQ